MFKAKDSIEGYISNGDISRLIILTPSELRIVSVPLHFTNTNALL